MYIYTYFTVHTSSTEAVSILFVLEVADKTGLHKIMTLTLAMAAAIRQPSVGQTATISADLT